MKVRALAVAVLGAAVSAFASPMSDWVRDVNNLRLGESKTVESLNVSVGHLKIRLLSGSAASVLAGSESIGLFFRGKGSFEYETTDAAELPLVAHNLRAIAHIKMTADERHAVLVDDFNEVLLVGMNVSLPQLTVSSAASLSDEFKEHEKIFGQLWIAPRSHELAVQKFSFPLAQFARAEFAGGHDRLLYEFDDVEDHAEELATVQTPRTSTGDRRLDQRLYPGLLSVQPIGHDRTVTPSPPFALSALDYSLTADGDNVKLEVTETIVRANTAEQVLRFGLRNEVNVRPGVAPRTLHLRTVTDDQGRPLPFDHVRGDLLVDASGLEGQPLHLKFSIDGDFLVREGGDNAWQLPLGGEWFPQPRQLAGEAFTVHSQLKVRKPFVPLAPGDTIGRREEGDYNVVENAIAKPVQFTMAEAGKYNMFEETQGGLQIRVATYAMRNDRAARQLAGLAFRLIDYYEYFLGPFPFKEFNIIQVNDYGFGQAPPATMFITNEAFSRLTEADRFFSEGINERFAHEIAHQYWAYVVRMPSFEEQWLTESFAEYSAALALRQLKGEASYQRLLSVWRGRAKDGAGVAPIPYANRIEGDRSLAFAERTSLLYDKGPLLLYAIHRDLGDTQFLTFLKSYVKSFNFKFGTTRDVAGLLQFMTKKDYRPFFEKYFWGTAVPD